MWKTLGQRSQHSSSPPFWHTAHQSSFGSSSFPKVVWLLALAVLLCWLRFDAVVPLVRGALEFGFVQDERWSLCGSDLTFSPSVLKMSWTEPVDTELRTGRGGVRLASGLLIWLRKKKSNRKTFMAWNKLYILDSRRKKLTYSYLKETVAEDKYHASTPSAIFTVLCFDICSRIATFFLTQLPVPVWPSPGPLPCSPSQVYQLTHNWNHTHEQTQKRYK